MDFISGSKQAYQQGQEVQVRIETSFTSETMDEIDEIIMRPKVKAAEPKPSAVLAGNSNGEKPGDEEGSDSESEYSSGEEEILNHRFKDGQYNPAKGTR